MEECLTSSRPEFYNKQYEELQPFDSNQGVGVEFEFDGEILKADFSGKKRKVVLTITSWVGISGGAIHVYGTLNPEDLYFYKKGNKNRSWSSSAQPEITRGAKIHVRRPLPQEEIDEDKRRYEYYDAGDYITGFMSVNKLIEAAKKIFKEKFVGDWEFKIDDRS